MNMVNRGGKGRGVMCECAYVGMGVCATLPVSVQLKGFRNVQISIETSGDISVKLLECTHDHSARDLELLILKEM